MDKTFVLIGGGEINKGETKEIDLELKRLTKKNNPNILFFPIAAHDSIEYISTFRKYFSGLGFNTDYTRISQEDKESILSKIKKCDIIYFGGGDTEYALEQVKRIKFIDILNSVNRDEIILAGISAGALIFCEDVLISADENNKKTKIVKGLGEIPFMFEPHFNEQKLNEIKSFLKGKIAYGIPEHSAIIVNKNKIKFLGDIKVIK